MPRPSRPSPGKTVISDEPLDYDSMLEQPGELYTAPPVDNSKDPTPDHPAVVATNQDPLRPNYDPGERYVSRIRVVDAWRYPGNLADHPSFVDPSWAAWGDYDSARGIEASPALLVPVPSSPNGQKLARIGDYVVRQEVTISHDEEPMVQLDVWEKQQFERLFIPTGGSPEPMTPPKPRNKSYTEFINENARKFNDAG